jgi:hypothetical protein
MIAASKAGRNAAKIRGLLEAGEGHADLYRTILSGPSGQRADLLVGRVRYHELGPDEFSVVDLSDGRMVGLARLDCSGDWSMTEDNESDGYRWVGYASSLSVGVDILVNGEHAALGRHDHRRISGGSLRRQTRVRSTGQTLRNLVERRGAAA